MSDDDYIRNPKGKRGANSKWAIQEEDLEDFEQEKLIEEWLEREGRVGAVDLKHINRKGSARNTLVKSSISLDQKVGDDGSTTFADLIVGSDGRDLLERDVVDEPPRDSLEAIHGYLSALGFNEGEWKCLVEMLKLSSPENSKHSPTLASDSEWWTPFERFSE